VEVTSVTIACRWSSLRAADCLGDGAVARVEVAAIVDELGAAYAAGGATMP
jgi:hypothetical protein